MSALEKLKIEKTELDSKIERLATFMLTEDFESVGTVQEVLLKAQFQIMVSYSTVLDERIKNLN